MLTALLASVAGVPKAQADDWLLLYPECAFGPESQALGHMALMYPRPGFPAIVEQGGRLVTRVRVPSGLTPPPGIQQERALVGWSAELRGQSISLEGAEHRYPLDVFDVRPDGGGRLVYRASIRIPAWAAPGVYSLKMTAPGGGAQVHSAVRIIAPGHEVRVGLLAGEGDLAALRSSFRALGQQPVDAWFYTPTDGGGSLPLAILGADAPVVVDPGVVGTAMLRANDAYFTIRPCESGRVRQRIEAIARSEELEEAEWRASTGEGVFRYSLPNLLGFDSAAPMSELAELIPVALSEAASGVALEAAADREIGMRRVSLVVPRNRVLAGESVVARWPGTNVGDRRQRSSTVVEVQVEGGVAQLIWSDAESVSATLSQGFDTLHPNETGTIVLTAESTDLRVAWSWERATRVGSQVELSFPHAGDHRVFAVAFDPAGNSTSLQTTVEVTVRNESRGGCGCGTQNGGDPRLSWLILLGSLVLVQGSARRKAARE